MPVKAIERVGVNGTLLCTKCQEYKTTECFRVNPNFAAGFTTWCRDCLRKRNTDWSRGNEKRLARRRELRKANPIKTKADRKRYYHLYKDKEADYMRVWRQKNRLYFNAWMRAYRRAKQSGVRSELVFWLRRFASEKCCSNCRRIRPHLLFDIDGRTKDGLTAKCLDCLPLRRSARGGEISLDTVWTNGKSGDGFSLSDFVADPTAENPETSVISGELSDWVERETTEMERDFLEAFMDNGFDIITAAKICSISQEEAQRLLLSIRTRASQVFDQESI